MDNSGQFVVEQSWNRKSAWQYTTGSRRTFNVDIGGLKRVEKGGFLLCSIGPLILSCCIKALQIFKFEIGVKKHIIYRRLTLASDLVDVLESFQFINISTDLFQ